MSFWDGYTGGNVGGGVTFTTKQGSGKKATLSNQSTSSFWGGYKQASPDEIKKMDIQDKLSSFDKLKSQDQYNLLNEARKYGVIDKNKQLEIMKTIASAGQQKIKEDFQKSLSPIDQFVGGMASTGQKVYNTLDMLGTGIGGTLATAMSSNKGITNRTAVQAIKDIENRKTITGDSGTWYKPTQDKGNIVEFGKSIASAAGEVAPYVMPVGGTLKLGGRLGEAVANRVAGGVTNKLANTAIRTGLDVAGKAIVNTPGFALSDALVQYGQTGKVDPIRALTQGAVGGLTTGILGMKLGGGSEIRLKVLKAEQLAKSRLGENLGIKNVESVLPKKISVAGGGDVSTVGVSRTIRMTDAQYTKEFNTISKSYDKAQKQLETMPPVKQKIMSEAIENTHATRLNALDEAYNNPPMKVQGATTQPATKLEQAVNTTPQVSKTVTPGETVITGGAKKLEQQTGVKLENPATYDTTSYKANKITAEQLVKNNKQEAFTALENKTLGDAQRQETYKALTRDAVKSGNIDDVMRLSKLDTTTEASKAAQTLGQSGYLADPKNPAQIINDLNKTRVKATEGRKVNVGQTVSKDVKVMETKVKVPNKYDWATFVDSLRCA